MQSLNWYYRRLRSMNLAELTWRLRGMLRDACDSVRIPIGLLPGRTERTSARLGEFSPGFRPSPVDRDDWQSLPANLRTEWQRKLLDTADSLLANRLSYFDLVDVDHGTPLNWHRDHSAGIDAPLRLSVFTDYRDFATYGDCKLVWEPNRHHQFVVLARAYATTGDKQYADKVAELMRSWIDANPFGYGMNWKSVLEHGVRVINWVWAIDLIRDSGAIDDGLWRDVRRTMFLAIWDAHRKFSRGSSANNHLVGEAAGVFVGACYFSDFPNVDGWADDAATVLEREIVLQTYDDGCTREHAFGYQFFVIQFFTLCLLAGRASGRPFTNQYERRLQRMYQFVAELCRDTGVPPRAGDADDGYVLDFGDLPAAPDRLLAAGQELFDDQSLAADAPSETVFWLTGRHAESAGTSLSSARSRSFPGSGYHLLRSKRMGVFFDCADLGYGPIAAHGHADCLSFCLAVDGEPVIVDAGTYDYFTHPDWREYFRTTRAHNTVEIDGRSQSQMLGPFLWGQRANAKLIRWHDDEDVTEVTGEHDGYRNLTDPVTHRRSLSLDKVQDRLSVRDELSAKASHVARLHLHLQPGLSIRKTTESCVEIDLQQATLVIRFADARVECVDADDSGKLGWISEGYHRKKASTCLRVEKPFNGNAAILTEVTLL